MLGRGMGVAEGVEEDVGIDEAFLRGGRQGGGINRDSGKFVAFN